MLFIYHFLLERKIFIPFIIFNSFLIGCAVHINVYFSGKCLKIKSHSNKVKANFHFNSNVNRIGPVYFRFLLIW